MTKEKRLVDTDVLIDYLRGISQALKYLEGVMNSSTCYISTITISELYAGVRDGRERQVLDQFIQEFYIAILSDTIAKKAGLIRRDYGKTHGVGLADAIIAATAEDMNAQLITLNKKHYPMLTKVHVPYLKNVEHAIHIKK